ncbi:MAG: 6-carboxytetrahydropterin synthase QueD [Armatimonadetes bacterium CG2_30_59_28]|nr:6-carboxytetrahydropterin synthase QueD [Armatimonadota bacterium]OIO91868.1 MAG: 6-carboxytetrahydropterin synthase QueD [Armatimonadetes bacterium CG2_30_59_28]PIU64475.1 MAG: 6-carboxytetrahydropterin synthase QueD [Armatimonadetes bacterium CG07_land_8_20_14_0_80_59_28]PIX44195.1 MAG: 6-carboxytetrahydropterin synthase QueD [Armatimonadetes bacterium CG_4_8_14_3_um_filter_58_9]PIY40082.1 MAG: 6-carboxytetrahydropterin synthase QueD [Armatimonadetes bacterium CG_4_10_14_3_um_filter_59_10]
MYEITVETHFNAAHFLRDYEGVCARMHGHNFDVIVTVRGGNLHPNGMLIDFKELKTVVEQRIDVFDHRVVNEVPPFDEMNPTVENFTRWLYEVLSEDLCGKDLTISRVEIRETEKYRAAYIP